MNEKGPILTTAVQDDKSQPRMYASWMIGVLIVFAVCSVFFVVSLGWWGAGPMVIMGLIFAALFAAWRRSRVYEGGYGCICAFLVIALIVMILPSLKSCREAARCMGCACNLKQISVALYYYEDLNGKFPPAFIADETGKPMHSWRVLLMPYIEGSNLYDEYDFGKPWDSPENRKILEKYTPMHIYHCPSDSSPRSWKSGATSYVAVLGEDTFWRPDGTPRKAEEITKGVSNTPVLIEIDNSGIPWGEPRDVKLDDFLSGKLSWSESCVHTYRFFLEVPVRGRNVAFADGSVRFVPDDLTPEQLRQFFSITEPFDVEKTLHRDTPGQIEFRHKVFWVWLATLFIQFVYIFFPTRRKA